MNLEINVNDYLLAWYLLYGASLSKEIDKFKKTLYLKYKKEYNFCYKDRSEIIKYGKDFIPDNDVLYNAVMSSSLFKSLKKETIKHKNNITKMWEASSDEINVYVRDILRIAFPRVINVYIIHPRLEIGEYQKDYRSIVWGSEKDKYDVLIMLLTIVTKGLLSEKIDYHNNKEIVDAIIELAVINEIGAKLSQKSSYDLGNEILKIIKRQIYPYWLMYLGYIDKESLLNKMINDRIGFDLEKYPIDKNIKKLNIETFTEFCIKNNKRILKLNNIMKMEREEEIEVL